MRIFFLSLLSILLLPCAVLADAPGDSFDNPFDSSSFDSGLPGDKRIKWLRYDETDVYTITTRYGYQTNIVFSPKEEIQTISVGDRSLWQIVPAGNRIFIRPMVEDITTNMTVLTNKHSYQFDLKSIAADKQAGNIYVAKFIYDDEKPKPAPAPAFAPVPAPATPAPIAAPSATVPSEAYKPYEPPVSQTAAIAPAPIVEPLPPRPQPGPHNYNYTYSGPDDLAPLQVYDDGVSTYIKYRDVTQPLPNAFIVGPNETELPVDYAVVGEYMIIDKVAGSMALRNSNGVVHIYNETINPQTAQ